MKKDLSASFSALQKNTFPHVFTTWQKRLQRLIQLERLLKQYQTQFCQSIALDFGHRSHEETVLLEIYPLLQAIRHAKKQGQQWMKRRNVRTHWHFWPAKAFIEVEPLGVVGIIGAWNYPLFLSLGPLIDVLCAGNVAILKLPEHSPHTSALLAKLLREEFESDVILVLEGDSDVAQHLCQLPLNHLIFTGSHQAARAIAYTCSEHLTPLTLELGGKSPAWILPHANLQQSIQRIMSGKLLNAGQTCVAPDFVLLPEDSLQAFITMAQDFVHQHYPNISNNTDYTHIVNDKQFNRLHALLMGVSSQHRIALSLTDIRPEERFFPPYLVIMKQEENEENNAIDHDEIFGPILPIMTYKDTQEAATYLRQKNSPLALYIFSEDTQEQQWASQQIAAGGVCINETLLHVAQHNLPFGGIGPSGMGAYHGKTGFERFSHLKPVFKQRKPNAMALLLPPYRAVFRRILSFLLRH